MANDLAAANAAKSVHMDKITAASLSDIKADEELLSFAIRGGRSAFGDNCAPCHGSGAQGFVGFPNLNDDDWIWGGSLDDIHMTIENGITEDTKERIHAILEETERISQVTRKLRDIKNPIVEDYTSSGEQMINLDKSTD